MSTPKIGQSSLTSNGTHGKQGGDLQGQRGRPRTWLMVESVTTKVPGCVERLWSHGLEFTVEGGVFGLHLRQFSREKLDRVLGSSQLRKQSSIPRSKFQEEWILSCHRSNTGMEREKDRSDLGNEPVVKVYHSKKAL